MGEQEFPSEVNPPEVETLLKQITVVPDLPGRMALVSARFLGLPYVTNPLKGGPDSEEVLTASLDGFDCVTYIETVHALALSHTAEEFIDTLRALRYDGGRVDWRSRNHYMTDWLRNNEVGGFVRNLVSDEYAVEKKRTLSVVNGLPHRDVSFTCFPKRSFTRIAGQMETGDLIFFVSVKKILDVFHTGLIVKIADDVLLRHATRNAGAVIEQSLEEFLAGNRMSGFILARPLDRQPLRGRVDPAGQS